MSLIWNNENFRFVSEEDSEWDKLEYVISRKLHIEYASDKVRYKGLNDNDSCRKHFSLATIRMNFWS